MPPAHAGLPARNGGAGDAADRQKHHLPGAVLVGCSLRRPPWQQLCVVCKHPPACALPKSCGPPVLSLLCVAAFDKPRSPPPPRTLDSPSSLSDPAPLLSPGGQGHIPQACPEPEQGAPAGRGRHRLGDLLMQVPQARAPSQPLGALAALRAPTAKSPRQPCAGRRRLARPGTLGAGSKSGSGSEQEPAAAADSSVIAIGT